MVMRHCCERMSREISRTCKDHEDPLDRPDRIVSFSSRFDEYAIIGHDGNAGPVIIQYCPWCGTILPSSKRETWLDTLSDLGYNDPCNQEIPEEFQSDRWFRQI
jgi:hypothetical protein